MGGRFYRRAGPWQGRHVRYDGFKFDEAGIARCAVGGELHHAVGDIVREAVNYSRLISPADEGEYVASFSTDTQIVPDIPYRVRGEPMARWSGRVVNDSRHALLIEVGGGNNERFTPNHRVLRRTLEWIELVADE
jgi:hypothetical protein